MFDCLTCPDEDIVWMYVRYVRLVRKFLQRRKYTRAVIVKDGFARSI